jgi:hypothetical protein
MVCLRFLRLALLLESVVFFQILLSEDLHAISSPRRRFNKRLIHFALKTSDASKRRFASAEGFGVKAKACFASSLSLEPEKQLILLAFRF